MHDSEWGLVKEIFHAVRQVPEPQRHGRLDELCRDDPELREEVEALLEADGADDSLLDSRELEEAAGTPLPNPTARPTHEGPGDRIGPYKLLQQIGEGGFGVVYMAEQHEPIRRRVALKVIKPGMDTKQVIARFEAERQALAMMDHPNIARVFDAGTTPSGRPYFVMELVKGIPITTYCDNEELDTHERLGLFVDVCRAAEHAHQAGIIHRDIKPTNVLVTLHDGIPVPKVIDFGVAKAIRTRLTETTLFTEFHQFIGTPSYMSPEQAAYEGLDADPRSDVYSLGVLLYELLTGTTPLDSKALKRAAYVEVIRLLKEEEPPRPSTRVTTVGQGSEGHAKKRGSDPHGLARLLRGDLDWIVMKALEKERRRRYDSAADMADDIGRYFESRPIEARPPSFGYKAQKLLRRRRGPFAAAAVVVLALVGDVAYVGFQRSRMPAAGSGPATPPPPVNELLVSSEDAGTCFFDGWPSPDGNRILHTDWCTGALYVRDLETGTMDFITDYDFVYGASWLPDGQRISVGPRGPFASPTIIDLETGAQEVPASLAGLPLMPRDWSVDGDHLTGVLRNENGDRSTVLMSVSSGERTVIKAGERGGRFSPDGRYVLFDDGTPENQDLFVLEVESGERWPLVDGPEDESDALWSPEGTTVAYQTGDGLWALPVTDGRPSGRPRLITQNDMTPLGWNEHGFYYVVYNAAQNLYRVGVDPRSGRATGRREAIPLPTGSSDPVKLRWSPDMQQIAVTRRYEEMLHLMKGEARTSFSLRGHQPDRLWWSADGREVLFSNLTFGDGPTGTVFAVDVQSGNVRELFPELQGLVRIHVSPDGQRWVGTRRNPDPAATGFLDLVISDLDEEAPRVLAGPSEYGLPTGRADQPRFSPDGSWVLFARDIPVAGSPTGITFSLWIIRPDGSDERMLVEVPFLLAAEWDPTSRLIAYQARDGQGHYLGVVSVDGGASDPVASFEDLERWRLLDWSPDGAWLAIQESVGRWEFWVNRDLLGGGSESTAAR